VGTSIYGNAEDGEDGQWQNIDIQAIDVSGHPEAISVQDLQSVPIITAETINEGENNQMSEEQTALIKEITNAKEELRVTLSETQAELKAVSEQRDELLEVKESLDELLALLGDEPKTKVEELVNRDKALAVIETAFEDGADIWSRVDVVDSDVSAIIEQVAAKIEELQNKSLNDDIRAAIDSDVELEALRPFATKHVNMLVRLGEVIDLESAKKAIAEFLADEDTKKIAQSLVSELAGGPVVAGTHVPDNTIRMPTAEEIAAARMSTGI
jgi:DNA repair exonuclease SbcCD ATPase subunit